VIELAMVAGELLRRAAETNGDGVRWRLRSGRQLDGFAHGGSGIALALARLATRTGDDSLARVAAEVVRGESAHYDELAGGWPDRRFDNEIRLMHGWCHGSAGIGATRLGLLETVVAADLEDVVALDLERARTAVQNARTGFAHLCCGSAGETEFLLDLARIRGDEGARRLAEERCGAVAASILEGERPRLSTPASGARASALAADRLTSDGYARRRAACSAPRGLGGLVSSGGRRSAAWALRRSGRSGRSPGAVPPRGPWRRGPPG
jgi:Lanthionine synthetase C-like protein